jgi:hypothetical protein
MKYTFVFEVILYFDDMVQLDLKEIDNLSETNFRQI